MEVWAVPGAGRHKGKQNGVGLMIANEESMRTVYLTEEDLDRLIEDLQAIRKENMQTSEEGLST